MVLWLLALVVLLVNSVVLFVLCVRILYSVLRFSVWLYVCYDFGVLEWWFWIWLSVLLG